MTPEQYCNFLNLPYNKKRPESTSHGKNPSDHGMPPNANQMLARILSDYFTECFGSGSAISEEQRINWATLRRILESGSYFKERDTAEVTATDIESSGFSGDAIEFGPLVENGDGSIDGSYDDDDDDDDVNDDNDDFDLGDAVDQGFNGDAFEASASVGRKRNLNVPASSEISKVAKTTRGKGQTPLVLSSSSSPSSSLGRSASSRSGLGNSFSTSSSGIGITLSTKSKSTSDARNQAKSKPPGDGATAPTALAKSAITDVTHRTSSSSSSSSGSVGSSSFVSQTTSTVPDQAKSNNRGQRAKTPAAFVGKRNEGQIDDIAVEAGSDREGQIDGIGGDYTVPHDITKANEAAMVTRFGRMKAWSGSKNRPSAYRDATFASNEKELFYGQCEHPRCSVTLTFRQSTYGKNACKDCALAPFDGIYPNRYRQFCPHHLSNHDKFHGDSLKPREMNKFEREYQRGTGSLDIYYHNELGFDSGM